MEFLNLTPDQIGKVLETLQRFPELRFGHDKIPSARVSNLDVSRLFLENDIDKHFVFDNDGSTYFSRRSPFGQVKNSGSRLLANFDEQLRFLEEWIEIILPERPNENLPLSKNPLWSRLEIENLRGFVGSTTLTLSPKINIFVGVNNAGKSTILKALLLPQIKMLGARDLAFGTATGHVYIDFSAPFQGMTDKGNEQKMFARGFQKYHFKLASEKAELLNTVNASQEPIDFLSADQAEPFNLIYPYFSHRKVQEYREEVNSSASLAVTGNLTHLTAKVDRLADPNFMPAHAVFQEACDAILGFRVSAVSAEKGKIVAHTIRNFDHIPIVSMGDGVASLLGMIVDLCVAENKIFVIEEPENDVHPKALRALLDLIAQRSASNQFFISTHSNIVVKHLASQPDTTIFHISTELTEDRTFKSSIVPVADCPTARRELLSELGYDFQDFDLAASWLFL